jgi:hypothetical protein
MAKKYATDIEKEKTSLFMPSPLLRAIKFISFTDERTQADLINEAISDFVAKWEKKNGQVPPPKA